MNDVTVIEADLPSGLLGFCDHTTGTIWLRRGLRSRTRRAVLRHELEHLRRGPVFAHWQAREEAAVEDATARALIPLPALLDALRWSRDAYELADELHVPVDLVAVRMLGIKHPDERSAVESLLADIADCCPA